MTGAIGHGEHESREYTYISVQPVRSLFAFVPPSYPKPVHAALVSLPYDAVHVKRGKTRAQRGNVVLPGCGFFSIPAATKCLGFAIGQHTTT